MGILDQFADSDDFDLKDPLEDSDEDPDNDNPDVDPDPEPDDDDDDDNDNDNPEPDDDDDNPEPDSDDDDDGEPKLESLNKLLGSEFTSVDHAKESVKTLSGLSKKVQDYETQIQNLQNENKELKELYDPEKIFINETEAKRQYLLKKYPDYDPSTITRVLNADMEKISPQEAVILYQQLINGDVLSSRNDVIEYFQAENDIDLNEEFDSLEKAQQHKVRLMAKDARKLFSDLKEKAPDKDAGVDILAERENNKKTQQEAFLTRKEAWEGVTPELHQKVPDLKINIKSEDETEAMTFKLGKAFRGDLKEKAPAIAEYYAKMGIEASDDNVAIETQKLLDLFLTQKNEKGQYLNIDKIASLAASNAVAKYIEEQAENKSNPRSKKDKTPNKKLNDVEKQHRDVDNEFRKRYGLI